VFSKRTHRNRKLTKYCILQRIAEITCNFSYNFTLLQTGAQTLYVVSCSLDSVHAASPQEHYVHLSVPAFSCTVMIKIKVKVTWIYIVPSRETSKALRYGSYSFTCKQHHACLYLVSIHQMAPPLVFIAAI